MNPNDRIREVILHYFYDRNAAATHEVGGEASVACSLGTLQQKLSEKDGLSHEQVTSNLTYLVDRGWVTTIERRRHEPIGGAWKRTSPATSVGAITFDPGTRETVELYYQISARGIDKIEGESAFRVKEKNEGINYHNIQNIHITGDGNIVNAKLVDLNYELERLKEALMSSDISDREKLNGKADIDSLKSQLAKERPNRTVVETLWSGIEKVSKAADLIDKIIKVQPFIASLISRL